MTNGIIVFAHGSRVESANEAVRKVASDLQRRIRRRQVIAAFLELGIPSLEDAAAQLAGAGVNRIIILPYFLTLGLHMERDLPRIVERISHSYNGLEFLIAPPLDGHPGLVDILGDRARAMLSLSRHRSRKT